MSIELEPLGPFYPLGKGYLRIHAVILASPTNGPQVVECLHEAEVGVGDVVIIPKLPKSAKGKEGNWNIV